MLHQQSIPLVLVQGKLVFNEYMELDIFSVRKGVAHSSLVVSNIPAQGQLVYILPKPLSQTRFCLLIDKLGIIDHYITLSLFWDRGRQDAGVEI